jgi:hypothetical protein
MKLKQLASNMTELQIGSTQILFSYETPVAIATNDTLYRTSKKWSVTTSKHIGKWSKINDFWELNSGYWIAKPQEWFDNFVNECAGFAPDPISHPEYFGGKAA